MELWDAYTREGELVADTVLVRGQPVPDGLYHMACGVIVRHVDGSVLCMKRSKEKKSFGGWHDVSAGGAALQGETKYDCVRRELREETGIEWTEFEEVSRTVRDCYATIFYSYLCTVDWPKDAITIQEGETEGYQWLSEQEFIELLNSDRMIPGQPERMEDWFRKMGYLR